MATKEPESSQRAGFCAVVIAENVSGWLPTVPTRLDSFRAFQANDGVTVAEARKRDGQVMLITAEDVQPLRMRLQPKGTEGNRFPGRIVFRGVGGFNSRAEAYGPFWNRILSPPWLNNGSRSETTTQPFETAMERSHKRIFW